jgi:hypothetical protein
MTPRKKSAVAKKPIRQIRKRASDKREIESINPTLAAIAALDDFGVWFAAQAGRMPADFELDL